MFESIARISFQNEVPDYWARLSKDCKPFNLTLPIEKNWKRAKKRVLFVLEHVSTEDLKNGALLSGVSLTALQNCYAYAESIAEPYGLEEKDVAFAAVNFNFFKNYHLDPDDRAKSHSTAAKRVRGFIEKYDPTHILLVGDSPTKFLLSHKVENAICKMGWVHKVELGGKKRKVCSTIDYADSLTPPKNLDEEDDNDNESVLKAAYVLGYFSRNISSLIHGKLPWAIDVQVKAHLIDTIKKFDRMMEIIEAADRVAFDTETANLNRIKNKLLIVQFSVDKDKGFVVPILHKDTPFSPKEIAYIQKRLREFFMRKVDMNYKKYLIAFNAKFDITQIKQALGIPFMYWPVYDVQAGEHAHDETLRFLEDTEYPMGGLAQVTCAYGNDFYYTAGFSKKDRGNMEATDLFDQDFQDYCIDPEAYVVTEGGRIKLKDFVLDKEAYGKVLSFNHETNKTEYKTCLNVSTHTTAQDMFEIEYEGGTIRLTEDHKVWSETRQQYVRVKDLQEGEEIKVLTVP